MNFLKMGDILDFLGTLFLTLSPLNTMHRGVMVV